MCVVVCHLVLGQRERERECVFFERLSLLSLQLEDQLQETATGNIFGLQILLNYTRKLQTHTQPHWASHIHTHTELHTHAHTVISLL